MFFGVSGLLLVLLYIYYCWGPRYNLATHYKYNNKLQLLPGSYTMSSNI